jgi:hypothetical protein
MQADAIKVGEALSITSVTHAKGLEHPTHVLRLKVNLFK